MPGCRVPSDYELAYKFVSFAEKYFSVETFETALIKLLNEITVKFTGVYVWDHTGYMQIISALKSQHRIKQLNWPWENRLGTCDRVKERKKKIKRFVKLKLLVLVKHCRKKPLNRLLFQLQEQVLGLF